MTTRFALTMVVVTLLSAGATLGAELQYKLYGVAHVSTEVLNNGDRSSLFFSSNATHIGIKGKYATDVEALNVVFQYESAADFNGERSNVFSSRDSFVGVQGEGWGRLVWGRHDTPMKTLGRKTDLFDDRIGDSRNAIGIHGFDSRQGDMILYNSPIFGDMVGLNLQYVPEEGVEGASLFSGSIYYTAEAYFVGIAYENHGGALTDGGEASGAFRLGAGFMGEDYKIVGLFHTVSKAGGAEGVSSTAWGLGASWRPSQWEPRAQFYLVDPDSETENDSAGMFVVGVDRHLSRKALLYLTYAMMSNGEMAALAPFYGGHGQQFPYQDAGQTYRAKPGSTAWGIALGLIARW